MTVGQEVRRRREAKGWSQAKLGVLSGTGPSGISQIETGRRNPSAATLQRIAEALEVEVRDLFPLGQPPLPDVPEERRTPSLQSWAAFVNRLADRWEWEIEEREAVWQAAEPAVRKHVKFLPNLNWANEIQAIAGDVVTIASDELEAGLGVYTSEEALSLFRALKRLDNVVESTKPWFASVSENEPEAATVYNISEAAERRAERKAAVERIGRRLRA